MRSYVVKLNLSFPTIAESPEAARQHAAEMLAELITNNGTEGLIKQAEVGWFDLPQQTK